MDKIILEVKNIKKAFGVQAVLNDVSFCVSKGEFVTVLGPSGCGKTTLLKIIGGMETQNNGNVILNSTVIDSYPPEKRNVNTVFQNYALFPNMNVFDNIAYGLKIKKYSKAEIDKRVGKILDTVGLKGFEKRKIDTLSGGQKQRVATARALCLEPEILLLDEPLGALDYNLKASMQQELKAMQKKLGTTFIYVTHDREEAFYLSDKIIILNNGKIEQIGTPEEIYNSPKSLFVAKFMGEPNVLKSDNGKTSVIYPENIKISDDGFSATVVASVFTGGMVKTRFKLDDGNALLCHSFGNKAYKAGDNLKVSWDEKNVHIIEDEK